MEFVDRTINNFQFIKEWDFTTMKFSELEKDFRFTPPWGDMVNRDQNSKFIKENVIINSEGLHFMTTKVNDGKVPYRIGGITTKKETALPPFGRIEAEVFIPQFKGQWPAFWTVDPVGTMPQWLLRNSTLNI